jgi:hypothetical protein
MFKIRADATIHTFWSSLVPENRSQWVLYNTLRTLEQHMRKIDERVRRNPHYLNHVSKAQRAKYTKIWPPLKRLKQLTLAHLALEKQIEDLEKTGADPAEIAAQRDTLAKCRGELDAIEAVMASSVKQKPYEVMFPSYAASDKTAEPGDIDQMERDLKKPKPVLPERRNGQVIDIQWGVVAPEDPDDPTRPMAFGMLDLGGDK